MDLLERREVDAAYDILIKAGRPIYFKELITDVIAQTNRSAKAEPQSISEVYTFINMDSRFNHIGKGMWGLTQWIPQDTKRSSSDSSAGTEKVSARRREKIFEDIQDCSTEAAPANRE